MEKIDYRKYTKGDVFWITFTNANDTSLLRQHAYVDTDPKTTDKGNISLCNRYHGWNGNEDADNASDLYRGELMDKHCCKICRKIFDKLKEAE